MITKDKFTEIFCIIDEFDKNFDLENKLDALQGYYIENSKQLSLF